MTLVCYVTSATGDTCTSCHQCYVLLVTRVRSVTLVTIDTYTTCHQCYVLLVTLVRSVTLVTIDTYTTCHQCYVLLVALVRRVISATCCWRRTSMTTADWSTTFRRHVAPPCWRSRPPDWTSARARAASRWSRARSYTAAKCPAW